MGAWGATRKVDDLVKALGAASGVSKSEVSRICAGLDRDLEAFRTRKLEGESPYVFADATYVKARVNGRVVSRAVVVATGVTATGEREVLGVKVGDSEDGAFWTGFLRSLRARVDVAGRVGGGVCAGGADPVGQGLGSAATSGACRDSRRADRRRRKAPRHLLRRRV